MKTAIDRPLRQAASARWLALLLCTGLSSCDLFAFPEPSDPVTQDDGGALHEDATDTSEAATDTDAVSSSDATDASGSNTDDASDTDALSSSDTDEPSDVTEDETSDALSLTDGTLVSGTDATVDTPNDTETADAESSLTETSSSLVEAGTALDETALDETALDESDAALPIPLIPFQVAHSELHQSAFGTDNTGANSEDIVLTRPAETEAGDFMLAVIAADHPLGEMGSERLLTLGWILVDQNTFGQDTQTVYLMYRIAESDEPDSYTLDGVNVERSGLQALLSIYRGVNPHAPINDYETFDVGERVLDIKDVVTATPAIETTLPNCLAIAGLMPDIAVDAPEVTDWPAGFTENQITVKNSPYPYAFGWAIVYTADRPLPEAGVVPESAFGWQLVNATYYTGAMTFVLALAPFEQAD